MMTGEVTNVKALTSHGNLLTSLSITAEITDKVGGTLVWYNGNMVRYIGVVQW